MTTKQKNEQIKLGKIAIVDVLKTKKDIHNAFNSPLVGNVSLLYGKQGNADKNFKGGFGVSHIVAKRDLENKTDNHFKYYTGKRVLKKLIDVVVKGKIERFEQRRKVVTIVYENFEANLSLDYNGKSLVWLITGYKIK